MKNLLLGLSIVLLFLSCGTEPTEKQKEFAQKLLQTPGILKTEWGTNLSLRVTVDLESLGPNPTMKAQLLADQIASAGLEYTGRSICANIYYGNLNKLADSCLSK